MTDELTPKARQTRQRILDVALNLFVEKGYSSTTMRDIAERADCSLGLAYRYFARKEEFVLALYENMAQVTAARIASMPREPVADRFYRMTQTRLRESMPYREAFGALFGTMVDPASGVSVFDQTQLQALTQRAFVQLVTEASDAPRQAQTEPLATLLHGLHFALILFWLYDRSPDQQATADLLDYVRETLGMLRAAMILPMIGSSMARLAAIMGNFLGGQNEP